MNTLKGLPQVLAMTTLNQLRRRDDIPADARALVESSIPSLSAIADTYTAQVQQAKGDTVLIKAARERALKAAAETGANAAASLQSRANALKKNMTPPTQNQNVLVSYRDAMRVALRDPSAVLMAYYEAAQTRDDTTMQAIETAPGWDKAFALSDDQRQQAARYRWGDVAETVEVLQEMQHHVIAMVQAVKREVSPNEEPLPEIRAVLA